MGYANHMWGWGNMLCGGGERVRVLKEQHVRWRYHISLERGFIFGFDTLYRMSI